jgi:hypothetical protein
MRGHEAIVQARLSGIRLARVDVEVLTQGADRHGWGRPGVEWLGDMPVGRIEVEESENPALLDLRCCHGLPVLVLASSYAAGWPVAERVADASPERLHFCAADMAVRYDHEGMQAWEM